MITLITGTPGASKTLYTLSQVVAKVAAENKLLAEFGKPLREVYYHGINELALPWIPLESPTDWNKCPIGSIIVIDECQTAFRPRANGSQVPEFISAFETHRHKGYDVFLITQHPLLVDQNIRRLVGQHCHLIRKFGMQRSTVHEWGSTHEITKRNMLEAVRRQFPFPKEAFSWYKSAELHTHKAKIPKRVWFLLSVPFLLLALGWFAWGKMRTVGKPADKVQISQASSGVGSSPGQSGQIPVKSKAQYYEEITPRLDGFHYTAPRYDDVTQPNDAPWPSACLISKSWQGGKWQQKCGCIDQQGNRYATSQAVCENIAMNGLFKDWGTPPGKSQDDMKRAQDDGKAKPNGKTDPVPGDPSITS